MKYLIYYAVLLVSYCAYLIFSDRAHLSVVTGIYLILCLPFNKKIIEEWRTFKAGMEQKTKV